ncbi:response regulator [Roseomonas gilardii subsp. gilardii]|uniref:response regulator n=1 Tax=Roseomonas gilardii TaxID=257708 RepID=UPI001FFB4766|nr:response regulator [Roseomonas gilardii]UPG72437.1 response regulator [Roseomonas gilardii subsp. gilardii]
MCDILVVDDDELVRATLSSILEMEGWCIREAASPDEATVVTESENCRVLITDINLGTPQDGFDVAAQLRRRRPGLPVVYVSGRPWVFDGRQLHQDERALAKPFRAEDLTRTVRELLRLVNVNPPHGQDATLSAS